MSKKAVQVEAKNNKTYFIFLVYGLAAVQVFEIISFLILRKRGGVIVPQNPKNTYTLITNPFNLIYKKIKK